MHGLYQKQNMHEVKLQIMINSKYVIDFQEKIKITS